jgi:hypothetical protein
LLQQRAKGRGIAKEQMHRERESEREKERERERGVYCKVAAVESELGGVL